MIEDGAARAATSDAIDSRPAASAASSIRRWRSTVTRRYAAMTDSTHWVGTWTAAPAPAEGAAFSNHTLRMTPRISLGGSRLRVRISNAYGIRPLAIGAARVGLRSADRKSVV